VPPLSRISFSPIWRFYDLAFSPPSRFIRPVAVRFDGAVSCDFPAVFLNSPTKENRAVIKAAGNYYLTTLTRIPDKFDAMLRTRRCTKRVTWDPILFSPSVKISKFRPSLFESRTALAKQLSIDLRLPANSPRLFQLITTCFQYGSSARSLAPECSPAAVGQFRTPWELFRTYTAGISLGKRRTTGADATWQYLQPAGPAGVDTVVATDALPGHSVSLSPPSPSFSSTAPAVARAAYL